MHADDPIIAVSSPPGRSARGLIRLSAESLLPVIEALFDRMIEPRVLTPVRLTLKAQGSPSLSFPLPALALYFRGPRSFTAQDILEIQLPGNPALLTRVLHHVLEVMRHIAGEGRLAEPGEFTQRAFTAGRIDLTRAEGIAATIGAVSDAQLEAAKLLRGGQLGQWAVHQTESLAQLLALVEAGIDFVDQEDVVAISPADLDAGLSRCQMELNGLRDRSRSWASLEAMPWVVLVGAPNAGKSTLFNALLGHERAVAGSTAGTTRDVLTEPLRLGDAEVMLVDIAGLDEPTALLDRAMQQAARDAIDRAELILSLHAPDAPPVKIDAGNMPVLNVRTKCDLDGAEGVSAMTGCGLDDLRARIAERLADRAVTLVGEMLALTDRHRDELIAAMEAIDEARRLLGPQRHAPSLADMELIAAAMRRGLDHLGALGGQMTPDDVIGRIFATFCIGK
ncbi:MAG: GTP-binding protein [Planctomycetes bacterium]|nr:GTP-binding protein [Planctomycetota bacterium]